MKIIEVPVFDEEGGIKFTQYVSPDEAQALLQFAINFLVATGMNVRMLMRKEGDGETQLELDD